MIIKRYALSDKQSSNIHHVIIFQDELQICLKHINFQFTNKIMCYDLLKELEQCKFE